MKIISFYLPQFHSIPENDEMWGQGFTEWTNVKKAMPLFEGHEQPVEPLDDNYYNLLEVDVMKWQAEMAKKHGIYGFCFYHYWYNGHMLLEKPVDNYLNAKDIDFPFCICWANHKWTSSWATQEYKVIYSQDYSDVQDWDRHFDYFLPFLRDSRYIRVNGKPLLVIYEAAEIRELNAMLDRCQYLAKQNGVGELSFAFQSVSADLIIGTDVSRFDFDIEYQPQYYRDSILKNNAKLKNTILHRIKGVVKRLPIKYENFVTNENSIPNVVSYDEVWKEILKMKPVRENSIPGAFVKMDTTPRIHNRGFVTQGMTPDKLYSYLKQQIINCREIYKKDMIFMFAWNEWAEGGYLEPDKKWGYGVLEAIKKALEDTNEFPTWDD